MVVLGQKVNGRYKIEKNIGEGGMANVFLAHDEILDRDVAVKVLRGDLSDDQKFIRRFQREAISASSLSHQNIVEMYDVFDENGDYFIVMEYVQGKTLKNLIKKRNKMVMSEIVDIMLQITDGMAHAHDSYIIHRDIKPQNIMILENGLIKITDFGIAMALNDAQLTQTNSVMGSVHYLPPEQANGKGSTIRSDVYSMGILMYELVTGRIPFKGENAVEIAIKQMREPLPSVCKNDPDVPQAIENIILKATAKNPKNRYSNSHEMHAELLTALDNEMKDVKRHVYKYAENDLEETKVLPKVELDKNGKQKNQKKRKKNSDIIFNILIFLLSVILIALLVGLFAVFIIYPSTNNTPDVTIVDVTSKTVVEAESLLEEIGLEVAVELEYLSSETIPEGSVIKTNPAMSRTVKEGTVITLYVSTGSEVIVLENYVGSNYNEAKVKLEEIYGLYVLVEKKDVSDNTKYDTDEVIEQSPAEGVNLNPGETVTLYIPNIINEYPNMLTQSWDEIDVNAFAEKYSLVLTKEFVETEDYNPGTIFYQSRPADSSIIEGTTLKVKIAIEPVVVESEETGTNE